MNQVFLFINLSGKAIDGSINSKVAHLTNQAIQFEHDDYDEKKESTIWSMKKFEKYLRRNLKKS